MKVKAADVVLALDTLEKIANKLEDKALLVVTIKSTSRNNLNYTFDVHLYYTTEDKRVDDWQINWTYSELMGMKRNQYGEIKGNGIGIDRAFEVANNLRHLILLHLSRDVEVNHRGVY